MLRLGVAGSRNKAINSLKAFLKKLPSDIGTGKIEK
jgi:hypothetical protein